MLFILLLILLLLFHKELTVLFYSVVGIVFGNLYLGGSDLIKYHVYVDDISNDDDNNFQEDAIKIIKEGWGLRYNLQHVDANNVNSANITMKLKRRQDLAKYHEDKEYYTGTKKEIRFSLTFQSPDTKPYIYIDYNNWKYGVPESGLTLAEYRQYVILHEFGHGLGFDHQNCSDDLLENGRCPVMFQSTGGCGKNKCGFNITKFDTNNKINGRNQYISRIVS